jgi:uncharacterized protein (TIGR00369 family)
MGRGQRSNRTASRRAAAEGRGYRILHGAQRRHPALPDAVVHPNQSAGFLPMRPPSVGHMVVKTGGGHGAEVSLERQSGFREAIAGRKSRRAVESMPEMKTQRRTTATKQVATRRRRDAHQRGAHAKRESAPSQNGESKSYEFVDRMMELNKTGELRSPVSQTLDMHLVEFARGWVVYEMPASEQLGNPLGVIQGGVATALADAAMAAATTTVLSDEEIQQSAITTIDIFARFMRPVNAKKIDRLRAEAEVVRAGGRLVWTEADVFADGELVGKFASTGIRVAFDPQSYLSGNGHTRG